MKRYFYTDPLAAAWMAKHHGFKIGMFLDDNYFAGIDVAPIANIHEEGRFYIHPDNVPLLEPRPGGNPYQGGRRRTRNHT